MWATIELIPGQRAVCVALFDAEGEWSGATRIPSPLRSYRLHPGAPDRYTQDKDAMYELGYAWACHNAESKGGSLDRFRWL